MNLSNINPFTLFLILILLILSAQPNTNKELERAASLLNIMQETAGHLKTGVAKMQNIIK